MTESPVEYMIVSLVREGSTLEIVEAQDAACDWIKAWAKAQNLGVETNSWAKTYHALDDVPAPDGWLFIVTTVRIVEPDAFDVEVELEPEPDEREDDIVHGVDEGAPGYFSATDSPHLEVVEGPLMPEGSPLLESLGSYLDQARATGWPPSEFEVKLGDRTIRP